MIAQQADNDTATEVWEKALDDRDMGYSLGPFYDEAEVTEMLGTEEYLCAERFGIVQKGKARGIDNAKANCMNSGIPNSSS